MVNDHLKSGDVRADVKVFQTQFAGGINLINLWELLAPNKKCLGEAFVLDHSDTPRMDNHACISYGSFKSFSCVCIYTRNTQLEAG